MINPASFRATCNVSKVSSYPHNSTVLNTVDVDFQDKLHDISLFEKINNILVNSYGLKIKFKLKKMYEIVGRLRYEE